MAVFTKLNHNQIEDFLSLYSLGSLENFSEIIEGIENSNYKIICNGKPYILTVFEKRVKDEDLPFFMNLKLYLCNNKFSCPMPLEDKDGKFINTILNKKAVIISFIEGNQIKKPNINECNEVGKMTAKLHKLTMQFDQKRSNSLDVNEWKRLFQKCESKKVDEFNNIFKDLKDEIELIEKSWPRNLPSGIVHADLFKDNIFFIDNEVSGFIDFFFSCTDTVIYDLATFVNAWFFFNNQFQEGDFKKFLRSYEKEYELTIEEKNNFNFYLKVSAIRFFLTRIYDLNFNVEGNVKHKNPLEFFEIFKFHEKNNLQDFF